MSDNLENLVRSVESDISRRSSFTPKQKGEKSTRPKFAAAFLIWLTAILLGAFQFDTVVALFSATTETRIESDLAGILESAAGSLRTYEINNGALPPVLPNPAIRGLVSYDRQSDYSYRLTATINNVTMVMDSNKIHPYRERPAN